MYTCKAHTSRYAIVLLYCLVLFLAACRNEQTPIIDVKRTTINPGDTLTESLKDTGISQTASAEIITHLSKVFNPRYCKPGDNYEVSVDTAGQWQRFLYHPHGMDFYAVERSSTGIVAAEKRTKQYQKTTMTATGVLSTSLWEAMSSQDLSPEVINDFADIFAWQVDFLTDPRVGDTYRLLWEQFKADDGTAVNGRILAAQYTASGQAHSAILFTDEKGQENYYGPDGKSLRRAFLKAPLQYRRISSFFTKRRYHPVLKYFRPHLGIDYAAPKGTPVSSVGDGTVIYAGWKGGFGKYVQVRHANGYVSAYGHLSGYGRGTRTGARVRQGQVIGYVGSTGLSTGPHLDFRITKNGSFINFLTLKFPPTQTVSANDKDKFHLLTKSMMAHLASITNVAGRTNSDGAVQTAEKTAK